MKEKEERALARGSIVGEKDARYSLCKQKCTEGRKEGADEKDLFFVGQRKENLSCSGGTIFKITVNL